MAAPDPARPFKTFVAHGFVALLFVAGACETASATNGLKLTAYGPRAAGRGGVDYAYSDDAIGPVNNPAGMAFVYGNRFDNNWAAIQSDVSWENVNGKQSAENELFFPLPAFSFGVFVDPSKDWEIAPLFDLGRWGLFDDEEGEGADGEDLTSAFEGESDDAATYGSRWRIGFGVFPVTGGKIQLKNLRIPEDPFTAGSADLYKPNMAWETDILTVSLTPSLAYRLSDHFSIGVNLQIIYSRFELDGGIAQPIASLTDSFALAGAVLNFSNSGQMFTAADLDDAFTFGLSGRIGLMFNSKYVSAGLVYQEKQYMADYLGRGTVDATDEVNRLTGGNPSQLQIIDPGINPALGFTSVYDLRVQDFEGPRMVGLGFALRPHRRLSFGFDYTYIRWSEVAKVFKTRLTGGSNPNMTIMAGSTLHVRVPLEYDDQHVFAFGLTALALEGDDLVEGIPAWALVLRAGYNYGKNPAPGATTMPQQPTIAEQHLTAGFTFHWGPLVELNFGWEWALPAKLDTPRGPVPNVSRSDFTLSNSTQRVELMFFHFGLGFNF